MMQCLQALCKGSGESEDSHSHFDNPFGDPNWRRPPLVHFPYKWKNNIKMEFPEFNGCSNSSDFVDWLSAIERLLIFFIALLKDC